MLDNLMLPKSPESRKQAVQDHHCQEQHLAPVMDQPKSFSTTSIPARECSIFDIVDCLKAKKICELLEAIKQECRHNVL